MERHKIAHLSSPQINGHIVEVRSAKDESEADGPEKRWCVSIIGGTKELKIKSEKLTRLVFAEERKDI